MMKFLFKNIQKLNKFKSFKLKLPNKSFPQEYNLKKV